MIFEILLAFSGNSDNIYFTMFKEDLSESFFFFRTKLSDIAETMESRFRLITEEGDGKKEVRNRIQKLDCSLA